MIKGRLWRALMIFLTIYIIFILYFFGSYNSDTTESAPISSPLQSDEQKVESKDVIPKESLKSVVIRSADEIASLQPVMTKGVLGNYEPKNPVNSSGPGENGAGVELKGEEEKKQGDKSVDEYGFNEVASEKISLDRHARDTR